MQLMKSLNILCYYQELNSTTSNKPDNYILFSVYLENDIEVTDNVSLATKYYVTVNYWYNRNCKDIEKYKQIKNLLKSNGFKYDSTNDLKSDTHFCKSMDFTKKIWN